MIPPRPVPAIQTIERSCQVTSVRLISETGMCFTALSLWRGHAPRGHARSRTWRKCDQVGLGCDANLTSAAQPITEGQGSPA